ncbi:FIST C-terminal domain-containing protein, partial [Romeria aff. gracilis LEGE 07310]
DLDSPPAQWTELIGVEPASQPHFILMADPFSGGTNELLQGMDFAYPSAVKIGGLAGIDNFTRSSGLFCGDRLYREGIVGVALSGRIVIESIVAQGCRPIGPVYRVVEHERNIILRLEVLDDPEGSRSQTPLELLQGVFQQLGEADRQLAQQSLFIGVAQSGFKPELKRGDFLIRNLMGIDPRNGAIAIADKIRPGMRIQFHLRDAQTSAEDLEMLLAQYQLENMARSATPVGGLMFACTGRGEGLYEEPNFDSGLFQQHLGSVPLSGFFCNGEIGPVGGTTFLHGFTSVFGICREPYP